MPVEVDGRDTDVLITTSSGWSVSGRVVTDDGTFPAELRNRGLLTPLPSGRPEDVEAAEQRQNHCDEGRDDSVQIDSSRGVCSHAS